jgi:hypothetical protein
LLSFFESPLRHFHVVDMQELCNGVRHWRRWFIRPRKGGDIANEASMSTLFPGGDFLFGEVAIAAERV